MRTVVAIERQRLGWVRAELWSDGGRWLDRRWFSHDRVPDAVHWLEASRRLHAAGRC